MQDTPVGIDYFKVKGKFLKWVGGAFEDAIIIELESGDSLQINLEGLIFKVEWNKIVLNDLEFINLFSRSPPLKFKI